MTRLCPVFLLAVAALFSEVAGQQLGQYAALPWSLAWLNPSYTGFYGGLGNVGQLNPDSSYLGGNGGQFGAYGGRGVNGGGYNYATGLYGTASYSHSSSVLLPVLLTFGAFLL